MPVPKQGKQDGKHLQTVKISGYFPKYNSSESRPDGRPDDEDEDNYNYDNDVDDFYEFNEDFECISTPTRERIMIKKRGKNKMIKVKGKFIMDGPWFIISFDAVLVNNVYDVQGTPTYSLRMEMGTNGEDILNKLLGYSFGFPSPKIPEGQMKEAFLTYFNQCRSRNKVKNFTFNQFFKALEEALKMEVDPDSKLLIQAAKKMIYRFDPFNKCFRGVPHDREEEEKKKQSKFDLRYIYRCYKCPVLFRVLPLLMEKEALAILSTDILSDLEELESVLKNSPEDLGFDTTMQEHGWGRVEASFQGFVKAGLIPANLFKCTQDSTQQGLSSKPPSNRKCHHDEPSTSTAHQDNAGTSSSRQTKRPLPLSVTMAKAIKDYDLVKSLCREGKHTFVKDYMMRKKEDHFMELQKRDVVTIEERIPQSETMYHWTRYRRYEEKIARALVSDLLLQTVANQSTPPTEEFSEFNLDEYQLPAVMHMWKSPVSIILGRGGCGKTHVVASYISKCLKERENEKKLEREKAAQEGNQEATDEASDGEEKEEKDKEEGESNDNRNRVRIKAMDEPLVLLTAPTGRAASIIGRRTGLKAKTLHSVLGTARMSEPGKFIYRKVEILVVDECSLVPISVLSGVLSALLRHSLKKVIFLGDPHQLPSIDPGNFLQDIIKVFKETNSDCIHTLKKNHRTDEGGRLINENSRKIAEEKRSDLQYQPDMFELLDTSARQAGNGLDQTIKTLLESKPQLKDDRNSQFVAFRNVDVKDINGICCRHYAAHAPYKKGGGLDLHIHDKICARKNGTIVVHGEYDPKAKEKKKKERERDGEAGSSKDDGDDGCRIRRINNGDTFFIKNWRVEVEQNKKRDIVTLQSLDEEEGKVFEVNLRDLIRNFKIEYAWARTINTYQGSETDHIVYVLSPNSPYENRQHLYTAITRGRKGCIIIGTPSRLITVIKKDPRERFTSLARFLKENLAEPLFSRCNYPGQVDPRTPERRAPNNFSGSNTGASASSPCLRSQAQEWSMRRSPLHLPAGSNPSTPASGQHQPNQWRMCEELANSLISNGHSTSRAVPVSGCESSSRSNGPSTSKAVLVSGCESSSIPNGPSFSRALPVSGCKSFSRSNGPSTSSAVLECGCESSSLGCMSLVVPVNGCGPPARATPACNQLSGNSRGSPSVGPSTTNTAQPRTSNRSPSEGPSSTHKARPVTSNRSNPSIALTGTSNGCSPSVKPSSGYQPLPGTSNRGSPSVRPSSGYQPLPGNSRGSPSVRPSSGYQPLPGTSSRGSPSVRPSSGYQPPAGNSIGCSPSVRPSSGYQPPAGNSIGCSPSVRTLSGFQPPPITSNRGACSPLVRPSPGHQPPPGTSNGRSQSVRSSPGHQPLRSSHAYISSSRTLPACNPVAEASSAYNSSGPVPLSDQSKAVDLPTPVATEDVQPEVRAKPNRDRLSRKRKVRAVASTVNQQVSSIHNGTVPVDSGEPKKFCARGSSLAMSSESAVAGEQMQLKKDPTSIENGREQARAKETSPGKDEREMPFTSVLPREQTFVVPSRCSTDGDEKKSHSTSRSHLKRLSDTLKEDVQSVATGSKVKRLATDGKVSTVSSSRYDRLSYNDTSICPRRAVDVRESPKRLNSCSRSPLRSLSSTSRNVLKPVSSKYPQGKEKSQIMSEINEMQMCSSKIQSVQQSSENSQEVQICVPGLYRGRYRFVRRLYSQDSEDQSSQHGKSTGWKEERPFEDSEDLELSQFLLQPPCAPQVHPPLNRLEECHEDADDDGSDESDDTLLSCPSDETVFSSSGTSPCLGTSGGFGDDEDEELSQFLFQHPSLQIL